VSRKIEMIRLNTANHAHIVNDPECTHGFQLELTQLRSMSFAECICYPNSGRVSVALDGKHLKGLVDFVTQIDVPLSMEDPTLQYLDFINGLGLNVKRPSMPTWSSVETDSTSFDVVCRVHLLS
jgi:hypothetical protein